MKPINIIIPVYGVQNYITRCVNSVILQSYSDFQLFLVDDGSVDVCGCICDEFTLKDDRLIAIHQQNGGLSAARNAGLDIATGKYVTFIDSDDYVTEDYLEYLFNLLTENNADVSVCNMLPFEDGTEPPIDTEKSESSIMTGRDACKSIYIMDGIVSVVACAKLYRRDFWAEHRFPVGRIHEDDATVPLILYDANIVVTDTSEKYMYRQRANSIMGSAFSVKRLDGIWSIEHCIAYFESMKDYEMAEYAKKMKSVINAKLILAANDSGLYRNVPQKYKMRLFSAWKTLYKNLTGSKFEFYLGQYHPKMVLPFEYYQKIKSLLGFRIR